MFLVGIRTLEQANVFFILKLFCILIKNGGCEHFLEQYFFCPELINIPVKTVLDTIYSSVWKDSIDEKHGIFMISFEYIWSYGLFLV